MYAEYGITFKRIKQASGDIYSYKRADMVGIEGHMTQCKDAYLSEDYIHMPCGSIPRQVL